MCYRLYLLLQTGKVYRLQYYMHRLQAAVYDSACLTCNAEQLSESKTKNLKLAQLSIFRVELITIFSGTRGTNKVVNN